MLLRVPVTVQELVGWLEAMFLYALVWAVGGCLDTEGRRKYDAWLRSTLARDTDDVTRKRKLMLNFPPTGLVYDYKFDNQVTGKWVNWSMFVDSAPACPPPTTHFADVAIPTVEFARLSHLMDANVAMLSPFIVAGSPGSGKSTCFRLHLQALSAGSVDSLFNKKDSTGDASALHMGRVGAVGSDASRRSSAHTHVSSVGRRRMSSVAP